MKTTIKGKVIKVETQTGTSAKGEWKSQTVVVETSSQYNNTIPVKFFNKDIDVQQGDVVEVEAYIGGREHQGRYFPSIDGDKLNVIDKTTAQATVPVAEPVATDEGDELPF